MFQVSKFRNFVVCLLLVVFSIPLNGCLKKWDYEEVESWYDEQPTTFDEHMTVARKKMSEGRPDKAEKYFKAAIKMIDSQYGPQDIRIATAADELAYLQEKAGDFKGAEATYRQALEARKNLSPKSADVVRNKKNLASVLMKLYRPEEAQEILDELKGKRKKRSANTSKSRTRRSIEKKSPSSSSTTTRKRRKRHIED